MKIVGDFHKPPLLIRRQGIGSRVKGRPRLYLDNHKGVTAPCQDINLANGRAQSLLQNAISREAKPPHAEMLGKATVPLGRLAALMRVVRNSNHDFWSLRASAR